MLTSVVILLAVFIILIIAGGYFGGAETAFTAMNMIKIKAMADEGDKRAKNAMFIADNFERALATLLIGNNITHIGAGAVATSLILLLWKEGFLGNISQDTASFLYGTVIATMVVFLFAEMIPKSKANDISDTLALRYARSLKILMKVFFPLAAFFGMITKAVSNIFKAKPEPTITEDELYDIIDTAEEEGVMDEAQSDILKSALDFSETLVSDVMTMREDIFCLDISKPKAELVSAVKECKHSRIPVYNKDPNKIIGVLNIRTFLKAYINNPRFNIRSTLQPPFFVSPDDKIDELFSSMRQEKRYMAMVGGPENLLGLVTIEDFLEELVGEIWDEDDIVDRQFIKLGGNRFLISTKLTLGEAFRRMKQRPPEKKLASKPIFDWLLEAMGHFPEENESFIYRNIEITIEDIENNVIDEENGKLEMAVFRILPAAATAQTSEKEVAKP